MSKEREVYSEASPWGRDVWVEFNHDDLPEGWAVQRVTTHRLICTRCRRFKLSWAVWDDSYVEQLSEHEQLCDNDARHL